VALLLAALATAFAVLYLALGALGASFRSRAVVMATAGLVLVVLPTVAFMAMGIATDRPYGQDGGVVQLPLAIDKILAGQSPYGADYSGTILGRQARASSFWEGLGPNPILHHHAYLPGTHLVMLPAHLLCRAASWPFDPRIVTLLFYAVTGLLAARVPEGASLRLAAAGVALLNPLVYWPQIFGANDVVSVALLLGAVLLARDGRTTAAGALTGLACATKQLAWPYAPFLLVAMAGARSFGDLGRRETWRQLTRPLAAAATVFLLVVMPVAALDFRAFWGDIVAYNVGLPGADNYPLGGTPGFGFANFLIYFGRVASLRDYFPFGIFYLLLVPIGLLLLRRQLHHGTPVAAFLTGSAALLLSLFFSRVVHPNYLIPAAILLPVACLGLRRRPDVAIAPLLLLMLAVELAEHGVFRAPWEQAAPFGWPARLGGLWATLAPRAGPDLTPDPLGLLFSALGAGMAVLYLTAAALGARRQKRVMLGAAAALCVVALPLFVLLSIGTRTGTVRAQDSWVVQAAPPDTIGKEAFSTSFRLDPPHELTLEPRTAEPGSEVLAALLRPARLHDPRVLTFVTLVLIAVLAARCADESLRPTALAVLLVPPLTLGTVLGSPAALPLAALLGAFVATRKGAVLAAGLLGGAACAFDPRALFALPFLLAPPRERVAWGPLLVGLALGYAALAAPVVLADRQAFVDRFVPSRLLAPGLGLPNLLLYWGGGGSGIAGAPLLAGVVTYALFRTAVVPLLAGAALATLFALWLAPGVSPEALALPLVLMALAAVLESPPEFEVPPEEDGAVAG